jgi:hypothetical protein
VGKIQSAHRSRFGDSSRSGQLPIPLKKLPIGCLTFLASLVQICHDGVVGRLQVAGSSEWFIAIFHAFFLSELSTFASG